MPHNVTDDGIFNGHNLCGMIFKQKIIIFSFWLDIVKRLN